MIHSENDKKAAGSLIRDMSPDEKPREKALSSGIESLSPVELLAIVFGSGLKGKSVVKLSREILSDIDFRLDNLAVMGPNELVAKYNGIGPAKAISLVAAIELGRRCQRAFESRNDMNPVINGSETVFKIMRHALEMNQTEEFWVLFLNRANRVMSRECVSKGGVSSTLVDVKVVMKHALERLASSIILVHNHPSGNMKPSAADDTLTEKIRNAAKLFDILVLDHLIIGTGEYYSYHDNGKF